MTLLKKTDGATLIVLIILAIAFGMVLTALQ